MPAAMRQPPAAFRDMLFGDTPLDQWGVKAVPAEPWSWFAAAREALARDDRAGAVVALQKVTDAPGLESRHYLVAWNALRGLGIAPPPERAKQILGVVVEMPVDDGVDILACYEDNTARYINHNGGIIVVDAPLAEVSAAIGAVIAASRPVVARIGPYEAERPGPPGSGLARLSFLTPSGLHFGQGPVEQFARDPMAGPVIAAATRLLQAVMSFAESQRR